MRPMDPVRTKRKVAALAGFNAESLRSSLKDQFILSWVETAARLPGRSLHVAVALRYAADLSGSASVHLSNTVCERFGLNRNAKYRGLQSLEQVGLVVVERKRGQSPLVTILDRRENDGGRQPL
jgi:hypothetical protein